ncbi:MAG: hypothetical protein IH849_06315 [Acidobacteria bacterium]|nr:hypothetical protein [Acidobacteriota bacterium]
MVEPHEDRPEEFTRYGYLGHLDLNFLRQFAGAEQRPQQWFRPCRGGCPFAAVV